MRQVQVFKWEQQVIDGCRQGVRLPDFIGTFHHFGQDTDGDGNATQAAIVEAQDGQLHSVYVGLVQFINADAPIADPSHVGAKWEAVLKEAGNIQRLRTPTGWLVREIMECAHIGADQNEYVTTGYDWRTAMAFVPDPDGVWLAAPGGAA